MASSKRKHCTTCGKLHNRFPPVCLGCQRAEKLEALPVVKCAFCDSDMKKTTISPYCSAKCSSDVLDIATKSYRKVLYAVASGELQKLDGSVLCVDCGAPAVIYDHRDYTKPLDVDPVCSSCNRIRGPADHFRKQDKKAA